jgi:hypothetical protein
MIRGETPGTDLFSTLARRAGDAVRRGTTNGSARARINRSVPEGSPLARRDTRPCQRTLHLPQHLSVRAAVDRSACHKCARAFADHDASLTHGLVRVSRLPMSRTTDAHNEAQGGEHEARRNAHVPSLQLAVVAPHYGTFDETAFFTISFASFGLRNPSAADRAAAAATRAT